MKLTRGMHKWKLGNYTEDVNIGHYNTCAVIDNSGVLLKSQCGAEIDSMDYVIRIDLPVIRGYERDVGRRTSMVIFNIKGPDRIRQSSQFKNRSQDVYESRFRAVDGAILVADKRAANDLRIAVETYKMSFPLISRSGRDGIRKTASKIVNKRMTGVPGIAGLVSVVMMTTICDRLYMYGFYPFTQDANNNTILYHYYPGDFVNPPLYHNFSRQHRMNQEYNFNRELHMQVGQCGN
ncbi:LOW QUALITY PROTEIN: alpha-2,8-sialyltransferase 8B-like [Branchiostoma floridae x Branchiostoma belcheri]